jgi:hypothetical protein
LDSAAAATPALYVVKTTSDDDSVLAGDATCAISAGTASVITHRSIVWEIRVVKKDVPNAPPDSVSDQFFASSGISCVHQVEEENQFFASSGISCVHQLEEVDTFVSDTNTTFIDGIDPYMIYMFDLHVFDSAQTASGSWIPTRFGLRSSTRSVTTPMLLLAPTFVEDFFTVILSSVPSPLS